jgi:predicted PurR-regulated permease PerM
LLILRPFLSAIILALLLVSIFYPAYRRIRDRVGGRENLAAAASVLLVFTLIVIPFLLFTGALVQQGADVFQQAQTWLGEGNLQRLVESEKIEAFLQHPLLVRSREFLQKYFPESTAQNGAIADRLLDISRQALQYLGEHISPLVTKTGLILVNFLIMLFVMFYAFKDGNKMLDYVLHLIPLAATHQRLVIERIRYVARAVLLGTVMTASTQAVLAMIAFHIVHIPAFFWGVMLGAASLVPFVGTALIWVPTVIYLFAMGKMWQAGFMLVWGLGISCVDNFLRPFFMKGQSGMSVLVLFFAILGGIRAFGPMGIIYGPLIFGLCAVLLYIYKLENQQVLTRLEKQ